MTFYGIIHKPDIGILESISLGFLSVTTAFCCYIGDDDFPNVAGLDACCSFLQDNPDFDSARGSAGYVPANGMVKILNSEQRPTLRFLFRLFSQIATTAKLICRVRLLSKECWPSRLNISLHSSL